MLFDNIHVNLGLYRPRPIIVLNFVAVFVDYCLYSACRHVRLSRSISVFYIIISIIAVDAKSRSRPCPFFVYHP